MPLGWSIANKTVDLPLSFHTTSSAPVAVKKAFAVGFFVFICWSIYLANTGTSNPFKQIMDQIPFGDKFGHFFLFGILSLLVNLAIGMRHFRSKHSPLVSKHLQVGSLCVLAFALAEELSQHFFPLRTVDVGDAICDVLGVGFFTALLVAMPKWWPQHQPVVPGQDKRGS